jgi:hypothetical protein
MEPSGLKWLEETTGLLDSETTSSSFSMSKPSQHQLKSSQSHFKPSNTDLKPSPTHPIPFQLQFNYVDRRLHRNLDCISMAKHRKLSHTLNGTVVNDVRGRCSRREMCILIRLSEIYSRDCLTKFDCDLITVE